MNATEFRREILDPALALALPIIDIPPSREASQMLLAIAGQESGWTWRYQLSSQGPNDSRAGPARGFWQFERGGGVIGVMSHEATRERAFMLCQACHVHWDSDDIWRALEGHDVLATGFARLLLWTHPYPLPNAQTVAWEQYLNVWRPGKPHPIAWADHWVHAGDAISATGLV